jgi:hypothetical protein
MEISKETRDKLAANLDTQHKLIAELRELIAPLGAEKARCGTALSLAYEYAFGDAASFNEPGDKLWYSRDIVAKALREGKVSML